MPVIDAAALADSALDHEGAGAVPPAPTTGAKSSRGRGERRDRIPKPRAARAPRAAAGERLGKETEAIGAALGQILSMPGAIFGMLHDPFLGDQVARNADGSVKMLPESPHHAPAPVVIPGHFSQTGPAFGMQLAKASETNPGMRAFFKRAMAGDSFAILLMGGIAYAAPPLVYLLTPNGSPLRHTFGVPVRPGKEPRHDATIAEPPEGAFETEPDTPEG